MLEGFLEFLAIDFNPLAAKENEPILTGQQLLNLFGTVTRTRPEAARRVSVSVCQVSLVVSNLRGGAGICARLLPTMIIITHLTHERPGDPEIVAFEDLVEGSLPVNYQLFLKSDNGGRPRERLFRLATTNGGSEEGLLDYFFALHGGRIGSLKRTWESYQDQLPPGHVPIATDSFGNLIVLKLGGPNPGQVYFWDHEEDEGSPEAANLSPIAGSFAEFVASLAVEGR